MFFFLCTAPTYPISFWGGSVLRTSVAEHLGKCVASMCVLCVLCVFVLCAVNCDTTISLFHTHFLSYVRTLHVVVVTISYAYTYKKKRSCTHHCYYANLAGWSFSPRHGQSLNGNFIHCKSFFGCNYGTEEKICFPFCFFVLFLMRNYFICCRWLLLQASNRDEQ